MKSLVVVTVILAVLLTACFALTVSLTIRLKDAERQLEGLTGLAEEYESQRIRMERFEDTLKRSSTKVENIETRLSKMDGALQQEMRDLRNKIDDMATSQKGTPQAGGGRKASGPGADLLKGLPKIDEGMLAMAMEHLSPMLGLNEEQEKQFDQVLRKHVDGLNKLRAEVESGERDAKDGMDKVEEELSQILEESRPILDEKQVAVLEQLVQGLREQAKGAM